MKFSRLSLLQANAHLISRLGFRREASGDRGTGGSGDGFRSADFISVFIADHDLILSGCLAIKLDGNALAAPGSEVIGGLARLPFMKAIGPRVELAHPMPLGSVPGAGKEQRIRRFAI